MLSSLSSRTKQRLSEKNNIWAILLIIAWGSLGVFVLTVGLEELYESKTFIIGQCRIKTIDFKFKNGRLHPRWNITVGHENQTIYDSIIASSGSTSENDAWIAAHEYNINETYSCYHSDNQTSIISWGWKWEKPSELKAYAFLVTGIILLFTDAVFILLRRHYQVEFQRQQEELELSSRHEEQLQRMISQEDQPQAIQWFGRV